MRIKLQAVWLLYVAVFAVACGSSHPSEGPPLDPDKELAELSQDDLRAWCTWRNEWYIEEYELESVPAKLCGEDDPSGVVGTVEDCMRTTRQIEPTCSQTVGRETECIVDEVAGECPAIAPVHEGSPCRWPEDCGYDYDE
jgi:hypothetical protein